MKNLIFIAVIATTLVACKKQYTQAQLDSTSTTSYSNGYSNGQTDTQANAVKAANLLTEMQRQYSSSTVTLVKFAKDNANFAVIDLKNNTTGEDFYVAIDVTQYTNGTTWVTYSKTPSVISYADLTNNGDGTFSCNSGTCFTYHGDGFGPTYPTSSNMVFEKTTASIKDLEKAAALVETIQTETMASNMAANLGLSEERALKIAKLAQAWEKLAKTRALTNADADAFSKELTGSTISQMENAYKSMNEGSLNQMNELIEKAARVNGTSPENMSMIMNQLFF